MSIHTVLIDRAGYVTQVWQNTQAATLDARTYAHLGTLMEVRGDVVAGWRWDGQQFVLPPMRPHPSAVVQERERRIETYFPARFREQVTALGGHNARRMHRYVTEVNRIAEAMLASEAAPANFRDDRYWPAVPLMEDLGVPVRHLEAQPAAALQQAPQPISITVAPVIHAGADRAALRSYSGDEASSADGRGTGGLPAVYGEAAQRPPVLTQEQRVRATVVADAEPVTAPFVPRIVDNFSPGKSEAAPAKPEADIAALKRALVQAIAELAETHKANLPPEMQEAWQDELAAIAAIGTASATVAGVQKQAQRVEELMQGRAA